MVFNGLSIAPSHEVLKGVVYLAFVVLGAACHVGSDYNYDAPPGGGDSGGSGPAGLNVSWSAKPDIPSDLGNNMTLTSATFKLDTLRVIGDAGDSRTSRSNFDLTWKDGVKPSKINFADAPTGLYSRVSIQADGHIIYDSYQIKGTVKIGAMTWDFEVHDRAALNVSLPINQMLQPGKSTTVKLQLQIDAALAGVDWTTVAHDDTTLDLDTTDSQMSAFRSRLMSGFVVDTTSPD
jgi:hypothetical protein